MPLAAASQVQALPALQEVGIPCASQPLEDSQEIYDRLGMANACDILLTQVILPPGACAWLISYFSAGRPISIGALH